MKITECLNTEHGVFLTQLAYLEEQLGQGAPPASLAAIVQTVARAVDTHKEMEEKFLYPAIEEACGPGFPPLRVMEEEHRIIEDAIAEIGTGRFGTEAVLRFLNTLRRHIAKEIQVLFPTAEQAIPEAKLVQMTCRCVEHVHLKAGVKAAPAPCRRPEDPPKSPAACGAEEPRKTAR